METSYFYIKFVLEYKQSDQIAALFLCSFPILPLLMRNSTSSVTQYVNAGISFNSLYIWSLTRGVGYQCNMHVHNWKN